MFKIYDGRNAFYQWDLDRKLILEDADIKEVHFCNCVSANALVCETYTEDGLTVVNVPNIMLQDNWRLHVFAYDGKYTKHSKEYDIIPRSKPADYIYTETEIKSYRDLEERINELKEDIPGAVEDYLKENPVESGATAEQAKQIEDNAAAIKELQEKEVDLTGYATEKYVDDAVKAIDIPEVDLTGYATEDYVETAISNAFATIGIAEEGVY